MEKWRVSLSRSKLLVGEAAPDRLWSPCLTMPGGEFEGFPQQPTRISAAGREDPAFVAQQKSLTSLCPAYDFFLSSFCCSSSSFSPFFAIFCHFRPRTKSPPSFPILDASLRLAEGASHKTGILGDNDLMSEISTSRCRCCELQEMNQEVWLVKHVSFTTRVHHGD